jgi:hypothetical protein
VRPSARALGYNSKWDRYSKGFLRTHPFCVDPFGRHRGVLIEARVTAHKIAHKGNEALMWNPDNHYPLCVACNSYQCATTEGGFGNKAEPRPQMVQVQERRSRFEDDADVRTDLKEVSGSPLTHESSRESGEGRSDSIGGDAESRRSKAKDIA